MTEFINFIKLLCIKSRYNKIKNEKICVFMQNYVNNKIFIFVLALLVIFMAFNMKHISFEKLLLKPLRKSIITSNKQVINKYAKRHNIPAEQMAGIIYNETDPVNFFIDKQLEILANANLIPEPTVGLAQVTPVSSLVEFEMGFNPMDYGEIVTNYSIVTGKKKPDTNSIVSMNPYIYEIKALIRKYFMCQCNSEDLRILEKTFNKRFIKDKKLIKLKVFNERKKQNTAKYNIYYLTKLLNRVKLQKYGDKSNLSDDEMGEIAKQYNAGMGNFFLKKAYFEAFKDSLPAVREWLKE